MQPTTIGNLLFERIVPEEFRKVPEGESAALTSKRVESILEQVAHKDPQSYREISHKLLRLGAKGSVETNTSFRLSDLESPIEKEELFEEMRRKVERIDASKTLTDKQKQQKKLDLYADMGQRLPEKVFVEAMKRDSGLARMVAAGARGSKGQLNSNIGADMAVSDQEGRQVPIPILSNYAEGLSPAEYFAASFGTRLGLTATKLCLSAGTEVRMADGSVKGIEDIRVGDLVVGASKEGRTFPVMVTATFDNGVREVWSYKFKNTQAQGPPLAEVRSTKDHKFLGKGLGNNGGGCVAPVDNFLDEGSLSGITEEGICDYIFDSRALVGSVQTHDIEVDHPDHLFVLANGLITSNSVQSGGYFCLSGDTLVRTPDMGSVPIKTIEPGDWVVGADKDGNTFPVRVKRRFDNGKREAYKFNFRIGRSRSSITSIVATKEHEVLARKMVLKSEEKLTGIKKGRSGHWGKYPLGEATKGFAMRPSGPYQGVGLVNEPLAFVIGYAIGDGMMRGSHFTISIGNDDLDVLDYLKRGLEEIGFRISKINRKALSYEYSVAIQRPEVYSRKDKILKKSKYLKKRFTEMGIWGKIAHEKTTPAGCLSDWDDESLWGLLGGLIASDGCVTKSKNTSVPEIRLGVTSRALCHSVYSILTKRLGVCCQPPRVRKIKGTLIGAVGPHADCGYKSNHDLWNLTISHFDSVKRVAQKIELPGRKGAALRNWLKMAPDADPSGRGGFAFHFLGMEDVGEIDVYDIEVDHPDHLYVLDNGMVVSNSKQLSAAASDLIITEDDCGSKEGLPVDVNDKSNIGGVLSQDVGGIKRGTIITPKVARQLKAGGHKTIVMRSPISCTAKGGGICKQCAGVREKNKFPDIGDNIGVAAANGVGMPVSQALLCLAGGTLVQMADGSTKPIEAVEPGDRVFGSDKEGRLSVVSVVRRYDNGPREVWRTKFRKSKHEVLELESTLEHKVLASTGIGQAGRLLPVGDDSTYFAAHMPSFAPDTINGFIPNTGGELCSREAKREFLGSVPTYDIEVDHPDHIFLLANGLLVENSTKHTAGVASAGGSSQVRGFAQIASLAEVPKVFPYAATLSELDGKVSRISDAPQGGKYIFVDNEKHYVPGDREVSVSVGDEVEAGDILSTGTPNPKEIVRHKGIGAGRAYFVSAMDKALKDNRTSADRRNLEIMGRALINHVRIGDDETNDRYLPDDVVEYSAFSSSYKPAGDTQVLPLKKARNMYLQRPTLHYSIGTRVTPSVVKTLQDVGREEIEVSATKPTFSPEMVRINDTPAYKDDFMVHSGQSQVKRNLGRDIRSGGAVSMIHGKHFAPALARGVDFGRPPEGQAGY